jgi:hypothetical protein
MRSLFSVYRNSLNACGDQSPRISGQDGLARLGRIVQDAEFSNDFLFGDCGAATLCRHAPRSQRGEERV